MKYKDQGVCANYHVYLKPDSTNDAIYQHRTADHIMTGVITEVPNQKNGMYYKICWSTADCNLSVEISFFKDDVTFDAMRKTCEEYHNNNTSPPTFHLIKKTKKTHPPKKMRRQQRRYRLQHPAESSEEHANHHMKSQRTTMRMTLIPSPDVLHNKDNELLNRLKTLDVKSKSDEGSDMEDMTAYLL